MPKSRKDAIFCVKRLEKSEGITAVKKGVVCLCPRKFPTNVNPNEGENRETEVGPPKRERQKEHWGLSSCFCFVGGWSCR